LWEVIRDCSRLTGKTKTNLFTHVALLSKLPTTFIWNWLHEWFYLQGSAVPPGGRAPQSWPDAGPNLAPVRVLPQPII